MAIPVLAAGIFVLDLLTPLGVVDWVLYFIPLLLSFTPMAAIPAFLAGAVFSMLSVMGFYLSPGRDGPGLALINLLLGIGTLWVVAVMVAKLRRSADETRKLSRAVEQSPVSICITDLAGRFLMLTPSSPR